MKDKPNYVTEDHLIYLDELRESGDTNMFGAAPFVVAKFGIDKTVARNIVKYWMEIFDGRTTTP